MGLDRSKIHERIDDALPTYLDISTFEISRKDNCFNVKIEMKKPDEVQANEQVFVRASVPDKDVFSEKLSLTKAEEKLFNELIEEEDKLVKEQLRQADERAKQAARTDKIHVDLGKWNIEMIENSTYFTPEEKLVLKAACKRISDTKKVEVKPLEKPSVQEKESPTPKVYRTARPVISDRSYKYQPRPTLAELGGYGVFTRKGCELDTDRKRFVSTPVEAEKIWIDAKKKYEAEHNCVCDGYHHKRGVSGSFITGGDKITETEVMAEVRIPKSIKIDLPISTGRSFSPSRASSILHDGYMEYAKTSGWRGPDPSKPAPEVCSPSHNPYTPPAKTRIVGDGEPAKESKIDIDPTAPSKRIKFSSTNLPPPRRLEADKYYSQSSRVTAADGRDIKPDFKKKESQVIDSVEDDVLDYLNTTKKFLNRNIDKAISWVKARKSTKEANSLRTLLDQHFSNKRY